MTWYPQPGELAVQERATAEPASEAVRLEDVTKLHGTGRSAVAALSALCLSVDTEEFVCIVGQSGCGKSTLLSLIAGLDRPSSGVVDTGGRRVALMFQEPALFPWLTAAANIDLALRARSVPRQERHERVGQLLRSVGLYDFADKRPHQLSGGMQQRVALARALAQDADVLLMDEPFGALDAPTRDGLHSELETVVAERRLTVVFVTHNVGEAVRLADRVVLLGPRPGRVVEQFTVPRRRPHRGDTAVSDGLAAHITARLHAEGSAGAPSGGVSALDHQLTQPASRRRLLGARVKSTLASLGTKILAVALVLAAWQLVYLSGWKPPFVLPGPWAVLAALWQQLDGPLLWHAIGTTMYRALAGFGLALLIGSLVGGVVSRNTLLRHAFGPIITGLQTMPAIAWFPFAIIFFGLHTSAILFVMVIGAAPSVAIGVIAGADHIPPLLLRAAKNLGLHGLGLYRHVILPASLPMFVSGLRQGWAFAWRSLMAGELVVLVADTASIGVLLENAQNLSDMPSAIAIMLVILLIGLVVDAVFSAVDLRIRQRWGLVEADRR
ncbi:ATP-binding cassette domain-containing protein [Mycobacterium sp. 050134]|uniref:ATP-binding cassette domain-containing protein n=1 Tax=Mycobacterium sp. 050134 TaxID=3096111 RepID=UPI002EDB1A6A